MVISKNNYSNYVLTKDYINQNGATFLLNKELTWTSNDLVSKLRSFLKTKKVGHAGSLDPFATGLMIISVSKDTKQINYYLEEPKEYIALIKLGARTKSFDAEHPETEQKPIKDLSKENLIKVIKSFEGKQIQEAPVFSAKKYKGKRQYELSRQNIKIEPKKSEIEIFKIELLDIYNPFIEIKINCSKGTYIRSIANDLGNKLECGGYLFQLQRTKIGDYSVDNTFKIKELINIISENENL